MIRFIAIHIHKTAGNSFRNLLIRNYRKKYFRINVTRDFVDRYNGRDIKDIIPKDATVVQGHFKFKDIEELYRETGAGLITWLREPSERVISHYYFRRMRKDAGFEKYQNIEDLTLMEFAQKQSNINLMSVALNGIALNDFFFVGITEHFSEDIAELSRQLAWNEVTVINKNSNKSYRANCAPVSEAERKEIKRLNFKDVELYNEALALREERIRGSRGNG